MSDPATTPRPPVRGRVRRLLAHAAGLFHNRLELFLLELQEEEERLLAVLAMAVMLGVFALMSLIALSVAILLWAPEGAREWVAGVLVAVYFLLTVFWAWRLRRRLRRESPPFATSLEELKKDREWLLGKD